MLKLKIEENELKVPVVGFRLDDGRLYKALIDTGSMVSIIDNSLPVTNTEERKIEISTLNGISEQSVTKSKIKILLGNKEETVTGIQMDLKRLITDIDVDMVIGSESLYEMNAVIDLDKNKLILK